MMVTIDDFRKLDLRIGRVLDVQPHPAADRLYLLRVDLGPLAPAEGAAGDGRDVRQLVAGVRPYYTAEELVGKQLVVVANLAPATIRGETSHGMILAALDGNRLAVLTPDRAVVAEGSRVS